MNKRFFKGLLTLGALILTFTITAASHTPESSTTNVQWNAPASQEDIMNNSAYRMKAVTESDLPGFTIINPMDTYPTVEQQIEQATGGVKIIGNVIYSDKPEGSTKAAHTGMVSFTLDGEITALNNKTLGGCYAGIELDGVYHNYYVFTSAITKKNTYYHKTYNTEDWTQIKSTTITDNEMPRALCTNGSDVYGVFVHDADSNPIIVFGKVDLTNNTHTTISTLNRLWNSCAYGIDGFIYAIDTAGDLYKVDVNSGGMTKVGATGAVPAYISGAIIDRKSGRMFWTVTPEDKSGNLYEVNLSTGAATKLCQFQYNDEIAGLYIPFVASAKAPAPAKDLVPNFPNGELKGSLEFKCPTFTADSVEASGSLNYKVFAGSETVAEGVSTFGATVTAPVTLQKPGMYEFSVILSNNEGESEKTILEPVYIGPDVPVAPTVKAEYVDGKFTIEWEAVTQGVNKGFIDKNNVTYTVTRMPDGVVVAKDTKALSCTDIVKESTEMEVYYYNVTATCNGEVSQPGSSSKIVLGGITPPYSNNFPNADSLNGYTIIDANSDGVKFFWGTGTLRISSISGVAPMDDWLITPPIYLNSGKLYKVTVKAHNGSASSTEQIEIKLGDTATPQGMSKVVADTVLLSGNKEVRTIEEYVSVTKDGKYYLGIHGCSQKKGYFLYIDSIGISAPQAVSIPKPIEDLSIEVDKNCELKATITGFAPSKDMEDESLIDFTGVEIFRNDVLIKQITDIEPGKKFSYIDDTMKTAGEYTYSVVATNIAGSSTAVRISAYVGLNKPNRVTDVSANLNQNGGVDITWTPPVMDIDGKIIPEGSLTYYILDATNTQNSSIVVQNLTKPQYTYNYSGPQKFFIPGIFASDAAGTSLGVKGQINAVGNPYPLPWEESFAAGVASSIFGNQALDNTEAATWSLIKEQNSDIKSFDNDGGFLACKTSTIGQTSLLFTGKISLIGAIKPTFKVYTYNLYNITDGKEYKDINELDIMVREVGSSDWKSLRSGTIDALCNGEKAKWCPISVDLSEYNGKQIQIGLKVKCAYYIYTMFDAMSVTDSTSGVIDTAITDGINIYLYGHILSVENTEGCNVIVSDILGRVIHSGKGDISLNLTSGIYIVKVGKRTVQLIVK